MAKQGYIPKIGDDVTVPEHDGTFMVTTVDRKARSANLVLLRSDHRLEQIPWGVLMPLTKATREDCSQATARVVREVTEKV
jgi:hypothetical protein